MLSVSLLWLLGPLGATGDGLYALEYIQNNNFRIYIYICIYIYIACIYYTYSLYTIYTIYMYIYIYIYMCTKYLLGQVLDEVLLRTLAPGCPEEAELVVYKDLKPCEDPWGPKD